MYGYRISGLSVSSDIEIPGLFPGPLESSAGDVSICRDAVPEGLEGTVAEGPNWAMAPGRFLLRVPGIVRFLLSDGHSVLYESEAAAEPGDIGAFLIGTAFGILLHQRGQIVLHASSVAVNGKAVLFMGVSGAGKSTLAAALGRQGYPLVTDDLCVVRIDAAGTPLAHPDGRLPKLWTQAIDRLELGARRGPAVRGRLEKFYVEPLRENAAAPLPVGAVYALREARAQFVPGIERPNIVDAALLLRQNAYRPRLVATMDQKALYFHLAAAIGNKAGVYHLTREMSFAAMPAVISHLEQHWAETGRRVGAA
jgi:hypothetical protein